MPQKSESHKSKGYILQKLQCALSTGRDDDVSESFRLEVSFAVTEIGLHGSIFISTSHGLGLRKGEEVC